MPSVYHHGNLRAALVEEGFGLARSHGADGVVLREVARRAGVSHNAAYRHFADRSALLGEIAGRAMAMLVEAMQTRLEGSPEGLGPVELARWRLRAIGRAYVEFALAEPGLFTVAFESAEPAAGPGRPSDPAEPGPFGLLNTGLDDLVAVGYLDARRRPGAEVACWSAVHGFAVLNLEGPLRVLADDARAAALDYVVSAIDLGLGVHVP